MFNSGNAFQGPPSRNAAKSRRNAFYGFYGDDDPADRVVRAAEKARPASSNDDDVKAKRVNDEIRGAMAGIDTTPDDDSLLRQENIRSARSNAPVQDEHTEQAERIVRTMANQKEFKYSTTFTDPAERAKFVEGMARQLRGGPATPATPAEEQEKPFSSNAFWGNPEELERAAKQVRPRKL